MQIRSRGSPARGGVPRGGGGDGASQHGGGGLRRGRAAAGPLAAAPPVQARGLARAAPLAPPRPRRLLALLPACARSVPPILQRTKQRSLANDAPALPTWNLQHHNKHYHTTIFKKGPQTQDPISRLSFFLSAFKLSTVINAVSFNVYPIAISNAIEFSLSWVEMN